MLFNCSEHATDGCVMVSTSAIKAIASIGIRLALSTELCVRRLLQLLDFDRGHVVSETLVALSSKCKCVRNRTVSCISVSLYLPRYLKVCTYDWLYATLTVVMCSL